MSEKHTPGPWAIQRRDDGMGINGPDHHSLEIVHYYPNGVGQHVVIGKHTGMNCLTAANARLIAAAPDLLSALRALCSHYPIPIEPGTGLSYNIEAGRAAIAKAEEAGNAECPRKPCECGTCVCHRGHAFGQDCRCWDDT